MHVVCIALEESSQLAVKYECLARFHVSREAGVSVIFKREFGVSKYLEITQSITCTD